MVFTIIYEFCDAFVSNFGPRRLKKPRDIAGQVVLITGAANGLGRQIAVKFATTGCRLVLCDIDEEGNEETRKICKEIGAEAHSYRVDMSDRQSIYQFASTVTSDIGPVDILINNAGILRDGGDFLDKCDEFIEKTVRVNMLAHIWMAKAFLPQMIERNDGHIVCICSLSGIVGAKDLVDYSASKFGAFGFQAFPKNRIYVTSIRRRRGPLRSSYKQEDFTTAQVDILFVRLERSNIVTLLECLAVFVPLYYSLVAARWLSTSSKAMRVLSTSSSAKKLNHMSIKKIAVDHGGSVSTLDSAQIERNIERLKHEIGDSTLQNPSRNTSATVM
ncbi:unnamed protein product [Cylicocyclus nassatus]|uniref:Uncharacterized protein n=1 Tax=Cylicocyclus nassatus TaxID=53992 RepID=A0AA36DWZ7_CYLNA|nr:unnamed protein product [Cylicocyclus nassatus]